MYSVILFIHLLICIALIGLILLQRGKGSDVGASFGAGASSTVFGAAGSASFLVKAAAVFGVLFFITSLTLGALASKITVRTSAVQDAIAVASQTKVNQPAVPTLPVPPEGQKGT